MKNSNGLSNNVKDSDAEIEKLKQTLLKNETKFSEEIEKLEKLGKNGFGSKTILFSAIIIFCSLFYYIKVNDQSLTQLNDKLSKESKMKDQKIDDLIKQLKLKDSRLKQVLSESGSLEMKIKELDQTIAMKDKRLKEALFEAEDKTKTITEVENNRNKIQTDFKDFQTNCLKKDTEIQSLLDEKQHEVNEIEEKFSHIHLLAESQQSQGQVLYSSNQTIADEIIEVIKRTLLSEDLFKCTEEPKPVFDIYKNCYRDMSIILHNSLHEQLGSYWVVSTGTVNHCFTINVINEKESKQHFLRFGDIYFEIFQYNDLFVKKEIKKDIPLNQSKQQTGEPAKKPTK